jgi:hypothetical protein
MPARPVLAFPGSLDFFELPPFGTFIGGVNT